MPAHEEPCSHLLPSFLPLKKCIVKYYVISKYLGSFQNIPFRRLVSDFILLSSEVSLSMTASFDVCFIFLCLSTCSVLVGVACGSGCVCPATTELPLTVILAQLAAALPESDRSEQFPQPPSLLLCSTWCPVRRAGQHRGFEKGGLR